MQFTSPWHSGARSRLDKGWGGGLILSKTQKSAATPALILPVSVVGGCGKKTESVDDRASIFDCFAALCTAPSYEQFASAVHLEAA